VCFDKWVKFTIHETVRVSGKGNKVFTAIGHRTKWLSDSSFFILFLFKPNILACARFDKWVKFTIHETVRVSGKGNKVFTAIGHRTKWLSDSSFFILFLFKPNILACARFDKWVKFTIHETMHVSGKGNKVVGKKCTLCLTYAWLTPVTPAIKSDMRTRTAALGTCIRSKDN